MTDDDLYPAYVVSHETWYAEHLPSPMRDDEKIDVQYASKGGGVKWEFMIERVPDIGIQIQMFDDAWESFVDFPDLFRELQTIAPNTNLDEVRAALDRLGFKDITDREAP